jgi:DNA processing protein
MRVINIRDSEWPVLLDELGKPPESLFVEGLPIEPNAPKVAIVGTRRPTVAGIEVAHNIATGLAQGGFTVVSGLAVGIDAAAHRAALDAGGRTIAVLGCGLDVRYPKPNVGLKQDIADRGTLITEYPEGTQPTKFTFPERNRIVAGLCLGVVVVEGGIKSGALVTARLGLEANRNVYAVPGSLRNPMAVGPNHLIKTSQAALVTTFKDICDDLAPSLVWSSSNGGAPAIDEEELSLLRLLDDVPIGAERLVTGLDLPPGRVAMALSRLEVRGWALRSPGGYALTSSGARVRGALETSGP